MLFSCGLLSDSRRTEEYAWGNVFLKPWRSNSLSKHGLWLPWLGGYSRQSRHFLLSDQMSASTGASE